MPPDTTSHDRSRGNRVAATNRSWRSELKRHSFRPVPVRERMIPKANGKLRRLGIAIVADRVVQDP